MRDGTAKTDKMKDIVANQPTWFAKLVPAVVMSNHEVFVIPAARPDDDDADPVLALQADAVAMLEAAQAAESRAQAAEDRSAKLEAELSELRKAAAAGNKRGSGGASGG
jgi:hypothetical protein